ncbi:MAG: winged helix-turn-helix transcriptional regulator, partial [Aquiluna sp.]
MLKSQNIRIDSEVDEIDRSILSILGKNGRISNAELASQVGIAASTCLGRVRSLVQRKVIRSFAADIAPEALGLELQALISVSLRAGARANLASFMTAMREHPQVIQVFFLGGA